MSTDISTDLRCVVLAVWPTDKNGYMPMGHEKTPLGNLLVIAEKPHVFETYNDAWFAVCFREWYVTTKIKSPERLPSFPQNVQIFRLTEYEEMPAIETP